mmetsp:Transcript_45793/g.111494  ORF Transcript_45793/g.111494 Transcript_45793/m.111494 type:complete len:178 (+) Transcript_45793:123-656(+)
MRPLMALLAGLLVLAPAHAALNAYLKVEGINGGVVRAGEENSMEVWGMSHEVVSPRDAASGLPTGKRQHKPLTITKPIDKATPLLMSALTTNKILPTVTLRMYQPSVRGEGTEVLYYTIKLENAVVSGIRHEMLDNKYPENMAQETREMISFTYQKITWTWVDGGITAMDDWESPVA